MMATPSHGNSDTLAGEPLTIAPWYGGRDAAVSLRFDDNLPSQLDRAVPEMDRFGIRGTFMVSPGRSGFKKRRDDWLRKVPAMGHELGDHTMHHKGARDPAEAAYEIGEAARIIREAVGDPDRLLVFASGGRKRWGGKRWSEAGGKYQDLPGSLNMIDLYDGRHPYINVLGGMSPDDLIEQVDRAAGEGRYQAFTFHSIGPPTLRDRVRNLVLGIDLAYPEADFKQFIQKLHDRSGRVWIAPIGDILKYQAEYASAHLEEVGSQGSTGRFRLTVGTDPVLYDQPLTLLLPLPADSSSRVRQDGQEVETGTGPGGRILFDVRPVPSIIEVDLIPADPPTRSR